MERQRFDRFADEYTALHARNIAITGEPPEFFAEYKISHLHRQLAAQGQPKDCLKIIDFGAGVGNSVPFFRKYFPDCHLVCADVSSRSLNVARQRFPGMAAYVVFDGVSLPFPAGSFDLAFTACVFHHVEGMEHARLLREIRRVLSPCGRLFLYEHNPLNPLTVRAVNSCPFDDDAVLIRSSMMRRRFIEAGYARPMVRYCVFFPRFLHSLRFLEPWLGSIPLGAQYCVIADAGG